MNFPKRLLLSFRKVLAFPKASSSGFDSKTCFSTLVTYRKGAEKSFKRKASPSDDPARARNFITNLGSTR